MSYDCLIRGGKVVIPGQGISATDIAIADGQIAALLSPTEGRSASAADEVDAEPRDLVPRSDAGSEQDAGGRDRASRGARQQSAPVTSALLFTHCSRRPLPLRSFSTSVRLTIAISWARRKSGVPCGMPFKARSALASASLGLPSRL